jgi:polysaccharide biosynthesis/export protein
VKAISLVASRIPAALVLLVGAILLLPACATGPSLPPAPAMPADQAAPDYIIGPGDNVNIFVWQQPDLSVTVPVRPDGRITTPLAEDVAAAGKTPTQLARDMEQQLSAYVRDPVVTVIVSGIVGPYSQQVRVIGQAANPQAIPYRENMTALDVMIAVGGLTDFAAGNRASIVRVVNGETRQYRRAPERSGQPRRHQRERADAARGHPGHSGNAVLALR